ncbi:MAG: efflux RND transporter periplasmic adaptor subunit, partial [Bacteroidetes bacterium]|nr:efflux RND transporter periplasmic adaptor subunit [Bacteroidota bacterium]
NHRMVHRRVVIEAPRDGVVLSKNVTQGARVMAGQELYRLADLSRVWIHASFYDFELPWISEGLTAKIELSYLPGVERTGVVSYIYPFLRQKARDVHVRIIAQNPDGQLKPGMFANVQLSGRTLNNVVVVPSAAIIRSGERTLVFVDMGDGRVDPREVRIGAEADDMVQIVAGLEAKERVVVSAQFLIDSESRLQEAIAKMRGPATEAAMDHSDMDPSGMAPEAGGAVPSAVRPQAAPADSADVDHTGHNH